MKTLSSVSEFANNYDGFVLDIWGVIHDGSALYPGVLNTMQKLKELGKEIYFLSNAPRRANKVAAALGRFGITPDLYNGIYSSGEVAYQLISNHKTGGKYYYIGPDKDIDLLQGSPLKITKNMAEADFVVTTGFDHDDSTLDEKLPEVTAALAAGLKLYCVNPDLIVVRQNGTKMLCAGVIGRYYEQQGGAVAFIGKPFKDVYDFVLPKFSSRKIAAIGDGLETDILGANGAGIDSVLVLGGILKAEKRPLEQVMAEIGAMPTATIPSFTW
jgi:HAD superfamily hydrolase (TIGR01459 family)